MSALAAPAGEQWMKNARDAPERCKVRAACTTMVQLLTGAR